MWAAFRVFDTNGDGVITKDELARILKEENNMAYVEMPPGQNTKWLGNTEG